MTPDRIRALAQELVGLQPDIILTHSTAATATLQRETRTIPIVFAGAGDSVAGGIVDKLNQPGSRPKAGRNHVQSRHVRRIALDALI